MTEFFMPFKIPTKTYQSGKRVSCQNGKPVFYEDKDLVALRGRLLAMMGSHVPEKAMDGAIRLHVIYCFKCKNGTRSGQPKITKPDTDNLQKLLKDCMTDVGFWKDDAQVACEIAEKYWSDVPGIYVKTEVIS